MKKELDEMWAEAEKTGKPIAIGKIVVCDVCDGDFTDSKESGGFIFCSSAYCPKCAEEWLPRIKIIHEVGHIRAYCPEGKSFADFVREYRGPDAVIQYKDL